MGLPPLVLKTGHLNDYRIFYGVPERALGGDAPKFIPSKLSCTSWNTMLSVHPFSPRGYSLFVVATTEYVNVYVKEVGSSKTTRTHR